MGMYIYGIRSPKHVARVELDNGEVLTVAKFAYAYKPIASMFGGEPRWQILAKARLIRMDKIWNQFIAAGGKWPDAAVMVGDDNVIHKDSHVMKWPDYKFIPTNIEDCSCNGATFAGKVVKILN